MENADITKLNQPEEGKNVELPVGRLKESIEKWKEITNSKYILDEIHNGYIGYR